MSYEHGEADNAFSNVNGKFSTLVSQPVPSPFAPGAAQYFQFQDARVAEGVASPSSWDELELRGAYTKGQRSFSGAYRYWDGDNDEGDLTEWSRSLQALTLTYWATPAPKWQWHLAWAYNDAELEAPATIPLFDG